MLISNFFNSFLSLSKVIEKDQWVVFKFIGQILGAIMSFIFNFVSGFTTENSLGITIILFTIVVRTIMLPMGFKQQKSMFEMRKLQPEMAKIKAKYGDTKDPELVKKMNAENQALYAKNKVNPLSGCLPMFITLPIFIVLTYILRNSYLFVSQIGDIYKQIFDIAMGVDGIENILGPLVWVKSATSGLKMDIADYSFLVKVFNSFYAADWVEVVGKIQLIDPSAAKSIAELIERKATIESFMGIDLVEATGLAFPGIIIPILSGVTTFAQTYIMNKQQPATEESQKSQQKIMLMVMPFMMTFMTINISAGVGVYWITGNIYQAIQQYFINNYYQKKSSNVILVDETSKAKEIIEIKNNPKNKKGVK